MNKFVLTLFLGASSAISFACSPGIGGVLPETLIVWPLFWQTIPITTVL